MREPACAFSRAAELNLGSLDFGGGAWMSARKDFSRVRIRFSSLMQGSKSYLPIAADNLKFLADAVNDTPVAFDISFGVLGGYALTTRMSLNGKVVQTTPQESAGQARANSTIVMGGVSYLVGGLTPIDVGYKVYRSGPMTSHSVYLAGAIRLVGECQCRRDPRRCSSSLFTCWRSPCALRKLARCSSRWARARTISP